MTLIYDTGNILSSVTSTGEGTESAALSFVSVGTPIALSSGDTYMVTAPAYWAATFPSSDIATAPSVFSSSGFFTDGSWGGWANSNYNGFNAGSEGGGLSGTSGNFDDFTVASTNDIPVEADFQYIVPAAVPEPTTWSMFGAGILCLLAMFRWRAAKATL